MIDLAAGLTFVASTETTDGDFEAFLDCVLEEFDNLGREVNLSSSLAHLTAEFSLAVDVDTIEEAVSVFASDLRAAIHAAQCETTNWPF